jgi:hypothetical protein
MHAKDDLIFLLLLLQTASSFFASPSSRRTINNVGVQSQGQLYIPLMSHQVRRDTEFIFGSDSADEKEEEEEDDFTTDQRRRQQIVNEILEKEDEKYKEERRKKKWGEFAGAKSKEDIRNVEKSIKAKISKENEQKLKLAELSGVQLDFLEADDTIFEENGNIQISAGSSGANWYNQLDEDLQKEWEDLESNHEEMADGQAGMSDTIQVNGKLVSRKALQGVRVGSAGGWSLELFPGDFLVHRRYGIGRFERTCVRPKSKLTEEEQNARDERRGEILKEELKKVPGGVTPEDIQRIRSKFGTEEDTDPISNPQSTVLESLKISG